MQDFGANSCGSITKKIVGKTIEKIKVLEEGLDSILEIAFTDGGTFRIHYDWIYGWDVCAGKHDANR